MNSDSKPIIVVIPVYKRFDELTPMEHASYRQCLLVLMKNDIAIVAPNSLDTQQYSLYANKLGVNINVVRVADGYFTSIKAYNRLLVSCDFFFPFRPYNYLLIYQLDAWVFNDALEQWIRKGYDFIGAPLFEGYGENSNFKFIEGQNGGVSLRNVRSSLKILHRLKLLKQLHVLVRILTFNKKKSLKGLLSPLGLDKKLKIVNEDFLQQLFSRGVNEDYRWSFYIAKTFSDFKVASLKDAISFCFEMHPVFLYELNNSKLPFAAHALEKYDLEFWKRFI